MIFPVIIAGEVWITVLETIRITNFFLRERMASVGIAIERLRIEFPLLNEYIVGVDAASDENAMEPWMFSQAFFKNAFKICYASGGHTSAKQ